MPSWKRLSWPLLLLIAGFIRVASAEVTIPDTPAGKVFVEWLDAFNSGDVAKVRAFAERHQRPQDWIDGTLQAREISGGLVVLKIEHSEPLKLGVTVQQKETERPRRVELIAKTGEPPLLDSLRVSPTEMPPELAPARVSQKEALKAVVARADELEKADRFSGVVLIAQGRNVLLERAWGKSNRETGAANTPKTRFRLGSQNKMFTAVAVLQLAEAGKLSLSDPLGKYLTDYPNQDVASKVTIHHLLTHTGGTGDIFGPEYDSQRLSLKEHGDYLKLYGQRALLFEPGSQDGYSNYGYVLLGALIEKVSGQSYYDYVRQKIFKPAGMKSTDSLPENERVPLRVTGYMKQDGKWVPNTDTLPYRGMSAGGGYSTAADLMRFARALQSGKLISTKTLADATSSQDRGGHYGYGFSVSGFHSDHFFGHGGGAPGMNAELRIYPQLDRVVVVLSNLDPPSALLVADYYQARMPVK